MFANSRETSLRPHSFHKKNIGLPGSADSRNRIESKQSRPNVHALDNSSYTHLYQTLPLGIERKRIGKRGRNTRKNKHMLACTHFTRILRDQSCQDSQVVVSLRFVVRSPLATVSGYTVLLLVLTNLLGVAEISSIQNTVQKYICSNPVIYREYI